jgi:hypothetical protein
MAMSSAERSASMSSAAYGAAEAVASSDAPALQLVAALWAQRQAAASGQQGVAAEAPDESGVAAEAVPQASVVARQPAALRALAAGRRLAAGQDAVRAVLPSVEPWAFRRGRLRLAPAQRRWTRFAPAMARSRIASPSGRSWQAVRYEGLS